MKTLFVSRVAVCFSLFVSGVSQAGILWQQDFEASSVVTDYVGTGANQADVISTSGAGLTWSVTGGALLASRTGNAGALTINGDNWNSPVLLVEMRMKVSNITAGASSGTGGLVFGVGSGFAAGNSHPNNTLTHSDFSLNLTDGNPDFIRFRDHDNLTNLGSGPVAQIPTDLWIEVWWAINNSGADKTYFRPDGSTATLTDDHWDLWSNIQGEWYQVGNNPTNTDNVVTNPLDDFKITFQQGNGEVAFDQIIISNDFNAVPEASTGLFFLAACTWPLFRRRR